MPQYSSDVIFQPSLHADALWQAVNSESEMIELTGLGPWLTKDAMLKDIEYYRSNRVGG